MNETAVQAAQQIVADSRAADARAEQFFKLIYSKPAEARDSAWRSVVNELCFQVEELRREKPQFEPKDRHVPSYDDSGRDQAAWRW